MAVRLVIVHGAAHSDRAANSRGDFLMDILLLYLFTRLDAIQGLCAAAVLVGGCSAYFLIVFQHETGPEGKKWMKRTIVAAVMGGVCMVLVPTKKDAALILAGWGVIEIARSETAGRLASKSVQIIEQTLDGYLKPKADQ